MLGLHLLTATLLGVSAFDRHHVLQSRRRMSPAVIVKCGSSLQTIKRSETPNEWSSCAGDIHHDLTSKSPVLLIGVVEALLERAGIAKESVMSCDAMDDVKGAYCNQVLRLILRNERDNDNTTHTLIAKIFSPLAQKRMLSVQDCLNFHQLAGELGLGPEVLATTITDSIDDSTQATTSAGVLMVELMGRPLTDYDLHGSGVAQSTTTQDLLQATARALARLHQLQYHPSFLILHSPTPGCTQGTSVNVLNHACEVMLSLCDSGRSLPPDWSLPQLYKVFEKQKEKLHQEFSDCDQVWTSNAHNDCKVSNIMLVQQSRGLSQEEEIRFVDWDLSGRNYRAYDLAKLFRTNHPTKFTSQNRRYFLECYASEVNKNTPANKDWLHPDQLEKQTQILLPMTWLEAAIFFVCRASNASGDKSKWNQLALDRLENFRNSLVEQ